MKNFALVLVISMFFASCSLLNDKKVETPVNDVPVVEMEENTNQENTGAIVASGSDISNSEMEDITSDDMEGDLIEMNISGTAALDGDTESEQVLSELVDEIEELFELAEQSGGQ